MYQVKLMSFPAAKTERIERIVQKHSGGKLNHEDRLAFLAKVAAGQPQILASYHEEHCAHNAIAEAALQGCKAELAGE